MNKLFITAGDDLFLTAKYLQKNFELVALYPALSKALKEIDVPCMNVNDFITPEMQQDATEDGLGILHKVLDAMSELKAPVSEKALTNLKRIIPSFVSANVQNLALLVHVLDTVQPVGALVHNDVEAVTRTVALWCKSHNKPCLHVPHAVYLDYERGPAGTDIHDMVTASHLAAAGTYQADWYVERGMKPENVALTGIPRFDRLTKLPFDKQRACQLMQVSDKKPVIAYFSSWRQDTNLLGCNDGIEESYVAFLEAAKQLEGCEFIIKTHPRGNNKDWHVEMANKAGLRCVVVSDYLDVVLQAMTVGVSYGPSNVILEGSILGKPFVSIGGFENAPEIVSVSAEQEAIRDGITKAMSRKAGGLFNFIQRYAGQPDGQATKRVAEFVNGIFI